MNKQYLVVKVAHETGSELSVVPVPGVFDGAEAEEVLLQLQHHDPGSVFMIQEVGAA